MTYDELKIGLDSQDDLSVKMKGSDTLGIDMNSMIDTQELSVSLEQDTSLDVDIDNDDTMDVELLEGIPISMDDYNALRHKPSINGVELQGDKSFEELGQEDIKNARIKQVIDEQYNLIFGGN